MIATNVLTRCVRPRARCVWLPFNPIFDPPTSPIATSFSGFIECPFKFRHGICVVFAKPPAKWAITRACAWAILCIV